MPSDFLLSKWYADVVDEATGDLLIYYWGELRWRGLYLRLAHTIEFGGLAHLQARASLQPKSQPSFTGRVFASPGGLVRGEWQGGAAPLAHRLLGGPAGLVDWECHLPRAHARAGGPKLAHPYVGLGYVERLTLSVRPWDLPIRVLHWGRFLGPGHSIVWLRWEGPEPRNLLYCNGEQVAGAAIGPDELRFGDYHLSLADKHPLGQEPLLARFFRRLKGLAALFPASFLHLHEQKWQTRATLSQAGQVLATGWAVHEKVTWP
jgi:hypothetical protein